MAHISPFSINDTLSDEAFFSALRQKEFARLDEQKHVYLDYTGGNLYPQSLLDQHFEYLKNSILGNPHSTNPTSQKSTQFVAEARQKVLDFFNATDYYCVFTANASASLQIVGECYPFGEHSQFLLTSDNHNSVNGIREYCRNKGGHFNYVPVNYEDLTINEPILYEQLNAYPNTDNKLFAFPAQSNVSGVKHPLSLIQEAHDLGWDVLLDAAAFVPTSKLDLSLVQPDFVSVSFYKIFGYPTGIGCLLVHKSKFDRLKKPWFAGGTVSLVSVSHGQHFLVKDHERFENGTVNYLDIPAITNGLNFIESIGIERINRRIKYLVDKLLNELPQIKHESGLPVIKIFGPTENSVIKGGTIILNFSDKDGHTYPIEHIEKLANEQLISIRIGCFCNPGIDEINYCITTAEMTKYFASRDFGDYKDSLAFLGKMRGAVRISVGIATTAADIDTFIDFAKGLVNTTLSVAN